MAALQLEQRLRLRARAGLQLANVDGGPNPREFFNVPTNTALTALSTNFRLSSVAISDRAGAAWDGELKDHLVLVHQSVLTRSVTIGSITAVSVGTGRVVTPKWNVQTNVRCELLSATNDWQPHCRFRGLAFTPVTPSLPKGHVSLWQFTSFDLLVRE